MTYRGIVKGNMIELEQPLPYPSGQDVVVAVEPVSSTGEGRPSHVLEAMHEPPHLEAEAVDELEKAINTGRLPVRHRGIFDSGE